MNTLFEDNEDQDRGSGGSRLKERPMLYQRLSDDEHMRSFYDFGDVLGSGNFGIVLQARARLTGMYWAIKIIEKSQTKYHSMKLLEREIRILRLITHPNVIHLEKVYESSKKLYLVFELCSSTLEREFSERRPFSEPDTREVIRKLASAVAYLHSNGIVHRDLKLENILLTKNPDNPEDKLFIKVTDFGQSVVRSGVGHDQMLHERCGTMAYMAPEVMESRMYSHQCDVWSMGVITYLLLVGDFPFAADTPDQLIQQVLNDEPRFHRLSQSAEPVSDDAKAAVISMLAKKPEFRITAAELCVHPWLLEDPSAGPRMNVLELMNSLMESTVTERMDSERTLRRLSSLVSNTSSTSTSNKVPRSSQVLDRRLSSTRKKK